MPTDPNLLARLLLAGRSTDPRVMAGGPLEQPTYDDATLGTNIVNPQFNRYANPAVVAQMGGNVDPQAVAMGEQEMMNEAAGFLGGPIRGVGSRLGSRLIEGTARRVPEPALPMDTASRMQRAQEQGFTHDVFHGTAEETPQFFSDQRPIFTTPETGAASEYAIREDLPTSSYTPNVMPLRARGPIASKADVYQAAIDAGFHPDELQVERKVPGLEGINLPPSPLQGQGLEGPWWHVIDPEWDSRANDVIKILKDRGFTGAQVLDENVGGGPMETVAMFEPKDLRSRFAAFDPARAGESDLQAFSPKVLKRDPTGRPIERLKGEVTPEKSAALTKGLQEAPWQTGTPWYSELDQQVTSLPMWRAPAAQWLNTIKNRPGIKGEELDYSGLQDWLAGKGDQRVSKAEVRDFLKQNPVRVGETVLGANSKNPRLEEWNQELNNLGYHVEVNPDDPGIYAFRRLNDEDFVFPENIPGRAGQLARLIDEYRSTTHDEPKFSQYQLPGGENYRETLLTLPEKYVPGDVHDYTSDPYNFHGSHFDEPNVLVHVRHNDRVDANGKKTLFLEEIQSDWHQKGREQGYQSRTPEEPVLQMVPYKDAERTIQDMYARNLRGRGRKPLPTDPIWVTSDKEGKVLHYGFAGEEAARNDARRILEARRRVGIPDAPFKTSWPDLALKRMIRKAAEEGYDQVAWTTGQQQADRYDLGRHVTKITFDKTPVGRSESGLIHIVAHTKEGGTISHDLKPEELSDHVGKDMADRIMAAGQKGTFEGLALRIGGEGMKGFYDKILVDKANALGKRYGARVGETKIHSKNTKEPGLRELETVHSLPITPELKRAALKKGFPLFGAVGAAGLGAGSEDNGD